MLRILRTLHPAPSKSLSDTCLLWPAGTPPPHPIFNGTSHLLMAQLVKNPPAIQETWVQSLGWEDPLEKEMTTHSCVLACRIPWTKEPGGLQSMGLQSQRQLST